MGFTIGTCVLFVVTLTSLAGAGLYAKISSLVLVVKITAIFAGLLAFVARSESSVGIAGFTGVSGDTFSHNLTPHRTSDDPFLSGGETSAEMFSSAAKAAFAMLGDDPAGQQKCEGGGEAGAASINASFFEGACANNTHTYIHNYTYTHTRTYIHTHTHTQMHARTRTLSKIFICIYDDDGDLYACTDFFIYVYLFIYFVHLHVFPCHKVFGVVFPAFTGVMAGANMSGDLADPARSIPRGSLGGVSVAILMYTLAAVAQALSVEQFLLVRNTSIMQDVCWQWWIVAAGIFASTFSSALSAITGASRILQAVSRDELIPALRVFGKGSIGADEPRRAILCSWLIAQAALFIGKLNAIAPILSMFFLLTYAIINLTCYVLDISGTPNFRPGFKYFSWKTSIFGLLVCMTGSVPLAS